MAQDDSELTPNQDMIISIENELARYSMTENSREAVQAVKICVYHVILKAIAVTKDPKANVGESMRLYELAQAMIAHADLKDESDLKKRLADLINAMVDQDDLTIQFRYYRLQNAEFFKTMMETMRNEFALKTEENGNLQELLIQNRQMLSRVAKKRSRLKVFTFVIGILFAMIFTITSCVVIIAALLNSGSNNYQRSSTIEQKIENPSVYKARE